MNLKNFNLIILTIVMIMAVSGCNKKTVNEVKNNDIDNKASTTGEVKTDVKDAEITEEAPEITSDIDTSDWKTYRNEEYGFEVKYPIEWAIDKDKTNNSEVVFVMKDVPGRESIKVEKNADYTSYENLKISKLNEFKKYFVSSKEIIIDGEKALVIDTSEMRGRMIYFLHNDLFFEVVTGGRMEKLALPSFRFLK